MLEQNDSRHTLNIFNTENVSCFLVLTQSRHPIIHIDGNSVQINKRSDTICQLLILLLTQACFISICLSNVIDKR